VRRRLLPVLPLALAVLAAFSYLDARQTPASDTVAVQLLAFNDFHGNLEPPTGSNGRIAGTDAGGAEYLATHLAELSARNPNTLIVSAGDSIGASPLLSGMFHDEPSIEALNAIGLAVSSVGNHEFDKGWRELMRIQNGGCHPVDGCQDGTPFTGAAFQYLAANVTFDRRAHGRSGTVLPAYVIKEVGGVRIGFIGMTLEATPLLVLPAGVAGLKFDSEAKTANRLVPLLKKQHVRAIVVLMHEGGATTGDDYNGCQGISGPIVDIANRMSDEIDVIVSGHTNGAYTCVIDGKLVTSASAFGRLITAIDLTIDRQSADVVSKSARNVIVTRDVARDPRQTAIIEHYRPFYTAVGSKVVGTLARDITREQNPAGESALGDLIADTMIEALRAASGDGAAVSFMNPGGLRADLIHGSPGGPPRSLTYAEASNVMPFRNRIVVRTMTGQMITDLLEQQFDNIGPGRDRILQVSRGFSYSYDRSAPRGRRVDPSTIAIDGLTLQPKQHYRVAVNEFLAAGGDSFTVFTRSSDAGTLGMDLDLLLGYLQKHSPVEPGPMNRIRRTR
jgi:5'-nucleotidase